MQIILFAYKNTDFCYCFLHHQSFILISANLISYINPEQSYKNETRLI